MEEFTNDSGAPRLQQTLSSATSSSASPSAAAATGGTSGPVKVAWLSVDPRSGSVSLYPPEVASRIEASFSACRRSAPLSGCGGHFENATVEFGIDASPEHLQRTSNGKRDVRRIEVAVHENQVAVSVVRERGWRIVEFAVPGVTEERRVDVSSAIPSGGSHPSASSASRPGQDTASRARSLADSDANGLVGLWEWCRVPEPPDPRVVPDKDWALYSEEHNAEIENAFRASCPSVTLELGIRTYDIMFDGPDYGRQVDQALRKRRYVRRRAVKPADRDSIFAANASAANAGGEDECAICFTTFAESASMPTVRLPCGHIFHGACARQLADRNSQCPMCRADVDWHAAFGPSTRLRM